MERVEAVVIDASVAVKWFNVEEYSHLAQKIRDRRIRGKITLVAPVLVIFDVVNALRYNPDYGARDVRDAVNDLLDLQLTLRFPEKVWLHQAVEVSSAHGVSIYDACYLALSKYLEVPI